MPVDSFREHARTIREESSPGAVREARQAHLRMWAAALKGGVLWIVAGFSGIALGG